MDTAVATDANPASRPATPARIWWRRILLGPSARQRIVLYEELASLAAAGIGIHEALASVAARRTGAAGAAITRIAAAVHAGTEPGVAFAAHPEAFPPVEAALLRAAERTGRYDSGFRAAAQQAERDRLAFAEFARQVSYPVLLVHVALLLPLPLVLQIRLGGPWSRWVGLGLLVLVALWAGLAFLLTHHANHVGEVAWSRRISRIPWAGNAVRSGAVARFAGAAGALFDAGVLLPDAVETAAECAGNGWLREDAFAAAAAMRRGEGAADTLGRIRAFPPEAITILGTGERSGTLAEAFGRIAQLERDRAAAANARTARGLHAIVFVTVSLVVAWMAFSLIGGYYDRVNAVFK